MSDLIIDAETYSELNVTKVGSRVYAEHPSTEVLLWSVRDPGWERSLVFEQPDLWSLLGELKKTNMIKWTKNEPLYLIHWGPFDRHIQQYGPDREKEWNGDGDVPCYAGPDNTFWVDLSQISLVYGGPAKLSHAAKWWGSAELKDDGKHLISRFCSPQPDGSRITSADDPMRWEKFRSYAGQDTNVMVPILDRFDYLESTGQGEDFAAHWPYLRAVDRMNERGVATDFYSAEKANNILFDRGDRAKEKIQTKYDLNINNPKKLAEFLGLDNAQRETLEEYVELPNLSEEREEVAMARLMTSGAASKKLVPILARTEGRPNSRIHDCFLYHGAWTRRLTSMGVQLQNLVREPSSEMFFNNLDLDYYTIEKDSDIFRDVRNNIRGFFTADDESVLVTADYNAIECRYSAWVANEKWLLDAFKEGRDPYLIMASEIYGVDITDKEDPRRQFGKTVELGAQYGLGWAALQAQCAAKGLIIDDAFAKKTIAAYRDIHRNIVKAWDVRDNALFHLTTADCGAYREFNHGTIYERTELAIRVRRPSGFGMYMWLPRIEKGKWPSGDEKLEVRFTGRLSKGGGVMVRKGTYGGDAFQGEVQGGAADYMLEGMLAAENAGFPPVMSVHDEVVTEIPFTKKNRVKDLEKILCVKPSWAKGLPVRAEGWQGKRFTK